MGNEKVWFITGASRGLGRLWAEAALSRGDKVAATARDPRSLDGLVNTFGELVLPLRLDVTDSTSVESIVRQAHSHFGRLDVVLSNAGYAATGALEECTVEDLRANFETNVVGTFSVIKAALPLLRAQGRGHILAVSSVAGLVTSPLAGIYHATKHAVEGLMGSLAQEVAELGIKVTVIEPGPFATDAMSERSMTQATTNPVYDPIRVQMQKAFNPGMFGDPKSTVGPLFRVIDADQPPLQIVLGPWVPQLKLVYESRIKSLEAWSQ